MEKKLRDVQVEDKDEKDKGVTKGEREKYHVQGSSSPLRGCWPTLKPNKLVASDDLPA